MYSDPACSWMLRTFARYAPPQCACQLVGSVASSVAPTAYAFASMSAYPAAVHFTRATTRYAFSAPPVSDSAFSVPLAPDPTEGVPPDDVAASIPSRVCDRFPSASAVVRPMNTPWLPLVVSISFSPAHRLFPCHEYAMRNAT